MASGFAFQSSKSERLRWQKPFLASCFWFFFNLVCSFLFNSKLNMFFVIKLKHKNVLSYLNRKDPSSFFSFPVTDFIAPGYSMIIKNPMDFSTMKEKIKNNGYQSIEELKVSLWISFWLQRWIVCNLLELYSFRIIWSCQKEPVLVPEEMFVIDYFVSS